MRQKKLMSHNQQNEGDANSSDCQSQYITDSSSASSQSQLSASIPDLSFKDDPRMDGKGKCTTNLNLSEQKKIRSTFEEVFLSPTNHIPVTASKHPLPVIVL